MATVTIYSDAVDGYVQSSNNGGGSYTNVRAGTAAQLVADTVTGSLYVGQSFATLYFGWESFISFDTSIVDNVTAATLSLYGEGDVSTTDGTVEARVRDWGASLTAPDWVAGASLGALTLVSTLASAGFAVGAYNAMTDVALVANINTNGSTRLVLAWDRMRIGTTPTVDEYVYVKSADAAGTTQDPKLVLTADLGPFNRALTGVSAGVSSLTGPPVTGASSYWVTSASYRGRAQDTISGLTTTLTLIGGIAIGKYAVARVAVDNAGTSGAAPGLTVTDARSNTWTVLGPALADPGAAIAGVAGYLAYTKVTTALLVNDDVTFTWGVSVAAKAIAIDELALDATTPVAVAAATASGASATPSISITPTLAGQMVYAMHVVEGPASDPYPADTDTVDGTWSRLNPDVSTTHATATQNVTVSGGTKVVSGTTAQTFNTNVGTTRDWAGIAVVFNPAAGGGASHALAGIINGVSTDTGTALVARPLAGQSSAISGISGALDVTPAGVSHALAGIATGASTTLGTTNVLHPIEGIASSVATTTGSLLITPALAGVSAGLSNSISPILRVALPIAGVTAGISGVEGSAVEADSLVGDLGGTSTTAGALSVLAAVVLGGQASGQSGVAAPLAIAIPLAGKSQGESKAQVPGALVAWALVGQTTADAEAAGALEVIHLPTELAGLTEGQSGSEAAIGLEIQLEGGTSTLQKFGIVFAVDRLIYRTKALDLIL